MAFFGAILFALRKRTWLRLVN